MKRRFFFSALFLLALLIILTSLASFGCGGGATVATTTTSTTTSTTTTTLTETWTIEGVVLSGTLADPDVVQLPDNTYRIYVLDGDIPGVVTATSTNCATWEMESGTRWGASTWPDVVKLSDNTYRLYYEYQSAIRSATSTDGLTFTAEAGIRLATGEAGSYDSSAIQGHSILELSGGSYRMYYQGLVSRGDGTSNVRILSAVSADGLTWTKEAGVRVDGTITPFDDTIVQESITTPYAIEMQDGTTRLYFKSNANSITDNGIQKAVSTDGLSFTLYITPEITVSEMQAVFSEQAGDPCLIRLSDGRYRMFLSRNTVGVISAISNDFD